MFRNERCPRSRWRDDHGRPRARHWTCIGDRRRRHRRPRTGRSRERTHAESRPLGRRHRVRRRRDRRGRPADTDRRAGVVREGPPTPASSSPPHTTRARQRDQALGGRRAGIRRRQNDRIAEIVEEAAFNLGAWDELGEHRHVDGARERHERALRESVAIPDDLSVVVDLGNGVGRVTADALHATGCDVETLNAQRDGRFQDGRASPRPRTARRPAWSSRPPTRTSGSFTTATPIG